MNEYIDRPMEKGRSIVDKLQEFLFPGDMTIEGTGYERNILDRRIENYLDEHFKEYIEDYGLVRELDIEVLESRFERIKEDVDEIDEFQKDVETELVSLRKRLDRLEEK